MTTQELTYNKREYDRQRDNARLCRECGKSKVIFLKDMRGVTVVCETPMQILNDNDIWMLDDQGIRFRLGPRKVGWVIHQCPKPAAKNESLGGTKNALAT